MPKTTKLLSTVMFDCWLKNSEKVPLVNFLILFTNDSVPDILSKTSAKSDISGVLFCHVFGSDSGVISLIA